MSLREDLYYEVERGNFEHEIEHEPKPEDAGTIRINAKIIRGDDILTFTALSITNEFISDDRNECQSKVDLINFLKEAKIDEHDIEHAMYHLVPFVAQITSSASNGYTPGCALRVSLDLRLSDDEPPTEETGRDWFKEGSYIGVMSEFIIEQDPEPEDAGTIRVTARILLDRDDILTFTALSAADEFINDNLGECRSRVDLNNFFKEAGIMSDDDDIAHATNILIPYMAEITSFARYSPECAVTLRLDYFFLFDEPYDIEEPTLSQDEEAVQVSLSETVEEEVLGLEDGDYVIFDFDHQPEEEAVRFQLEEVFRVSLNDTTEEEVIDLSLVDDEHHDINFFFGEAGSSDQREVFHDYHRVEEILRVSFNETNTISFRPASNLVVGSLSRKIYKKSSDQVGEIDMCTVCLEEFNNGKSVVTLPCGHEFDDACIVEWFAISHLCPLCRFELPCEV